MRSVICAFLISLLVISGACAQQQTYNWSKAQHLYSGILHTRIKVAIPRPMNINCMRIDVTTSNLKFYTTPKCSSWEENKFETQRKTTRDFMRASQATDKKIVAAINGDYFSPWPVPWNEESLTNIVGLAVSEGTLVSPANGEPSFIVAKDGSVSLATTTPGYDISNVQTAVSGPVFVLVEGKLQNGGPDLQPRTAIGIDQGNRYVFFMTIDGRQAASLGATLQEVGSWLGYFGAYNGINCDGGGSTTMAWWNPNRSGSDKAELFNLPVGTGNSVNKSIAERCNGNSIGVYFAATSK